MLRAKQLDPFLGPAVAAGARTIAAGLSSLSGAVAAAVPYAGTGLVGAFDIFGSYAVIKEGIAAFQGTCKP
jgi:hypothetical protein